MLIQRKPIKIEQRPIAMILGTGAEDVAKLGHNVGDPLVIEFKYSVSRTPVTGVVQIYDAEINGVRLYLMSRHCSESGEYVPAYNIDHRSNIYFLTDKREGCGARAILATSLVGGCKITDWSIGDLVVVRDCINEHPDTHFVNGIDPYKHAHGLFDKELADAMFDTASRLSDDLKLTVRDGGVYLTCPSTTGAKFETPAEMLSYLAPAYQQMQIDSLFRAMLASGEMSEYSSFFEDFRKTRAQVDERNFPNLVGMSLGREAPYTRTLSNGKTKFGGFSIISDFPEIEETDHEKNVDIAFQMIPKVIEIYAEMLPYLNRKLKEGKF